MTETVEARQTLPADALPFVQLGDEEGRPLHEVVAAGKDRFRELLTTHGALLFRGYPVHDVGAFEAVVRAFSGEPLTYNERSSPRSSIKGNVYTSTDYPQDEEIFLHNENSYQAVWPRVVYFYCDREALTQGATPLADVRRVYQAIDPGVREEFERRGWMVVRNYREHFGVAWPEVFGTTDKAEVERYCADRGMVAEWPADNHLRTKALRRASYVHPDTGEDVWFNHITFFHHTSLDEDLQEGLLGMFGEDGLPTNTYYGDGAPIPADVIAHLRACYRAESRRFTWRHKDVLLVDNMLAAHGREPFTGPRKIAVAMGEAHVSEYLTGTV